MTLTLRAKYRIVLLAVVSSICAACASGQATTAKKKLGATDVDTMFVRDAGTRIPYGTDSLQFGDLRLPPGQGPFPVAIVVHGGCYYSPYATLRNTASLAQALTDAGIATWNVEYRRYDSPGGGWPNTFYDVAAASQHVRQLAAHYPLDTTRIATTGHSAGGQLVLWLASLNQRTSVSEFPASPVISAKPIPVVGVVALGPITDMREYYTREKKTCGNPAIESVLGAVPDSAPWVRLLSPLEIVPLRVPTVLVAGADDAIAPRNVLEAYATAARAKGDVVEIITTSGEGHFDVIAPMRDAGKAAVQAMKKILRVNR